MTRIKYITAVGVLSSVFFIGCSSFQDTKQSLSILGSSSTVMVNDQRVMVPSIIKVDRNKSVTINKYKDNHLVFSKTLSPVPSVWGKLDTWGVYFLFPGIGLFSPGALQLDSDIVVIP